MDPATLATTVTSFLIPYLSRIGEKFAEDAGKNLWNAIAEKFKDKPAATGAADEFAETADDPDNQEAFTLQLKKVLKEDPDFAKKIVDLLSQSGNTGITNTKGTVATNGSIGVGNIGVSGDVNGNIIVGSNNSVSQKTTTKSGDIENKGRKKGKH